MNARAGRWWRLRFLAAGAMLIALQPSPTHAFPLPATCRDQRPLTTEETGKPAPELRRYIDATGEQDPTTSVRIMCGTLPRIEREYGGRSLELARWAQMLATPLIAYLDRHDEALPLLDFAQPILERELGAISPEVSEIHVAHAWIAFRRGLLAEAGARWEQALRIRERIPGPRKIELQKVLVGLAQVRLAQREFAAARAVLDRAHAILVENDAAVSEAGAAIENAYGQLAIREENFAEARRHVESQVDIEFELSRRAGPGQDVPQPVTALVTLGMVLERLDEFDESEQALRRAVGIAESAQGPPQRQYLPAYTQLGILLNSRGKPAEALPFAERAVEVGNSTIGPDAPRMVRVLQSLGEVQRSLGELPQALRTYERAGGIVERHRADVERQTLVAYYGGLGNLHLALGAPGDATRALATGLAAAGEEPTLATERAGLLVAEARIVARRAGPGARALLEEALALFRTRLPERHPIMLRVVNELCGVEVSAGTPGTPSCSDAMARLQQSQTVDPGLRADTFESLSRADEAHGDTRGAIDHAVRAVSAASTLGTPDPMWHAQFQLARLLRKDAQDGLAIFFGKQAITEVERERAWLRGDDARLQPGFLANKVGVYRTVADWLMEAGRMDEALEVLGLLKSEELRDFVVRGETLRGDRTTVGLTTAEQLMLDAYTRVLVADRTAGAEIDELSALRESSRITPEERLRLESLLTGQEQAEIVRAVRIRKFLDGRSAPTAPSTDVRQVRAARLDREVQRLGADSALAVYLLTEDRLRILVATRREQREFRVAVDAPALRRDIGRLLDAIVERQDVMPLSQSLYRTLLAPVDEAARRAGAKHLVVWPDGALRYVPFAALHDGRRYVIERYSVSLYGDTGQRSAGADAPTGEMTVRGLGVTRAVAGYQALPAMADELCSVVRGPIEGLKSSSNRCTGPSSSAGALPGEGYADAAFTEGRLKSVLDERGRFSVLHLGTHFDLRPGNAVRSFLVLGDGSRLTLDRISQLDFGGIGLVTLSACQTALGGAVTDEGREIEGLSAIIQRRGADRVIASLWKVEDGSTATLMSALYGSLSHPDAVTAEALQHAQVELIHPRWPAGSPYAHPYYWAGFTLVSNRP